MTGGVGPGMRWRIIGPNPAVVPEDTNSASLVLSATVSGVRLLLLADTGEEEQRWLLHAYPELRADVVKVAHHGSRDQSSDWYAQLDAAVALISVGENRYGHPNDALLSDLRSERLSVYRTDELGSIALSVRERVGERVSVEVWSTGQRD